MNMQEVSDALEVCENLDIEAEHYAGYSGRGMYGKTTEGVRIAEHHDMPALDTWYIEDGYKDGIPFRRDALGMGAIIY